MRRYEVLQASCQGLQVGVLGFGMLWNLGPLGLEGFCGVGGDRRARLGPTVQVA